MQALRRDQRKALGEIEPHLAAEDTERAGAGAVAARGAIVENVAHQVEILVHGRPRLKRRW